MSARRPCALQAWPLAAALAGGACGHSAQSSVDTPITVAPAVPATPARPAVGVPRDSLLPDRVPGTPGDRSTITVQRAMTDSLRGIVAVVGSQPMTHVVVRSAGGSTRMSGVGAAGLRSLSGAEVVVWGSRPDARTMTAVRFAVRTVDGVAAVDGILERMGDVYTLRLADGSYRPVTRPSPALREHVGARVWVTGAADVEPQAFGVIE